MLSTLAAVAALWLYIAPAQAADMKPPAGAVVLTIGGEIANTNRPPFDEKRDSFLKFHERKFARAMQFDRAMLDGLGTHEISITFPGWGGGPVKFKGPRLSDVLKAAGWQGKQITTLALDGFGTKIAKADIDAHDWVLATATNGSPLGIGQRGPLWLVFDPPGDRPATKDEEGKWPWAIFFIHAE